MFGVSPVEWMMVSMLTPKAPCPGALRTWSTEVCVLVYTILTESLPGSSQRHEHRDHEHRHHCT